MAVLVPMARLLVGSPMGRAASYPSDDKLHWWKPCTAIVYSAVHNVHRLEETSKIAW
jgi:hypothetical protein